MNPKPSYTKGEEVVFCPMEYDPFSAYRGASGTIISRQVKKAKGQEKTKSFLVKWKIHRKGVSCFRVKGQKRAKSDWITNYLKSKDPNVLSKENRRFEEKADNIYPISYCHNCPLRLNRLVAPCKVHKKAALAQQAQVEYVKGVVQQDPKEV